MKFKKNYFNKITKILFLNDILNSEIYGDIIRKNCLYDLKYIFKSNS